MDWQSEPNVARVMFEIILLEQEYERGKQSLSLKADFNIPDCFGIFDLSASGFVTKCQFIGALTLLRLYPTNEEVDLVYKRYNRTKDKPMSLKEFEAMICPRNDHYRALLMARK